MIKACIFDLDGVVVDTAKYHYIAWRRIAKHFGLEFTEEHNESLKGISRKDSLDKILQMAGVSLSAADKAKYCATKNTWYLDLVRNMSADEVLPGIINLIHDLKQRGIKIAIGSASKNARYILDQVSLFPVFDAVVDGNDVTKSKPDPEVFHKSATLLGASPSETLVLEDSEKGLEAAKAGGFMTVGVGANNLDVNSDLVVESFEGISLEDLLTRLSQNIASMNVTATE